MNRLFIAEKPSVGRAIAQALGVAKMHKTHCETKSSDCITWCFGHLMELCEPDAYLPSDLPRTKKGTKIWRFEDLPILPEHWQLQVKPETRAQFAVIGKLLQSSRYRTLVNCGDPDREGQLLVDEILEHFHNRKPVLRYWASAVDPASVKKGLQSLRDNQAYAGMKGAAEGRRNADWLIGMNGTRAFTLAASQRQGRQVLLTVGRVQTPTLNLVARRDEAIAGFKPVPFYVIKGLFEAGGRRFSAGFKTENLKQGLDGEGRLIDKQLAAVILQDLQDQHSAEVLSCKVQEKLIPPPLGLSLSDLQSMGNSKYGLSAQEVLDHLQALYEKHKLTTYPRSDCQYLPEVQHAEAPDVLSALEDNLPELADLISEARPELKGRIFNDRKISAHHAIIPTTYRGDLTALNEAERSLYELIARNYLMQFFPPQKVLLSSLTLKVGRLSFVAQGRVTLEQGFAAVASDHEEDSEDDQDRESTQALPDLQEGDRVTALGFNLKEDKTRPPAAFTEGTLIKAMENIYRSVPDERYQKLLKDGEGIGTSATRAGIISELKRKGYLALKKKKLSVTPLGLGLLRSLPELCKNPVLTAMFESELKKVELGESTVREFELQQHSLVRELIRTAKEQDYGFQ